MRANKTDSCDSGDEGESLFLKIVSNEKNLLINWFGSVLYMSSSRKENVNYESIEMRMRMCSRL